MVVTFLPPDGSLASTESSLQKLFAVSGRQCHPGHFWCTLLAPHTIVFLMYPSSIAYSSGSCFSVVRFWAFQASLNVRDFPCYLVYFTADANEKNIDQLDSSSVVCQMLYSWLKKSKLFEYGNKIDPCIEHFEPHQMNPFRFESKVLTCPCRRRRTVVVFIVFIVFVAVTVVVVVIVIIVVVVVIKCINLCLYQSNKMPQKSTCSDGRLQRKFRNRFSDMPTYGNFRKIVRFRR